METPQRRQTVPVRIRQVTVGGGHQVVVQSMTNTDTANAQATAEQAAQGRETRARAAAKMAELLDGDKVLILPTTPGPAPFLKTPPEDVESFRQRILRLTCVAGLARLPQVNLPLAAADGAPVGISILAASGGDMMLLGLAREIMRAAG